MTALTVNYWLARYTRDLFRQEPRNVGVFAALGSEVQARFFAERRPGHVDGRSLKSRVADPAAFGAWVAFWRRTLASPPRVDPTANVAIATPSDLMGYITRASKGQYSVTPGGEVAGVDASDGLSGSLDYLYRALVADEDFWSITSGEDIVTDGRARLRSVVENAFREANVLGEANQPLLTHGKVVPAMPVKGHATEPHRPDFVQENGKLYVMAVVDFATTQIARARDHAGSAAYIFRDLTDARGSQVSAFSLIRQDGDDDPDVRWGLEVLRRHSDVIDWDSDETRESFMAGRRIVASGA